ncbi:MAG TPA: DUF177 domain-containing protein [Pyrinomonadaceae bacterium]
MPSESGGRDNQGTKGSGDVRIEVERLNERGESFAHTYNLDALALDDEDAQLTGETRITGRASRKDEQVRLVGKIETGVEVHCSRCLRPVKVPVEAEFDERYIPAATESLTDELAELQPDDLGFSTYEGESVDVDDLVREQVLLALPMRPLCREDCKGLCPTCGTDLNVDACSCEQKEIDPRWAALASLKQEKKVDGES